MNVTGLGRITPSFRMRFKEQLNILKQFKEALLDLRLRESFDSLIEVWSSELGAMSYAKIPSALDCMLVLAVLDNRKLIMKLEEQVASIALGDKPKEDEQPKRKVIRTMGSKD